VCYQLIPCALGTGAIQIANYITLVVKVLSKDSEGFDISVQQTSCTGWSQRTSKSEACHCQACSEEAGA
jgi:hypothetical protein